MAAKIIVGFDGSDRGKDALALAELLAEVAGADLIVATAYTYDFLEVSPMTRGYEEELRARAAATLEHAQAITGDDYEFRLVAATSAAQALHNLAEDEPADLVVVGSTARGAVGRVLPGSVGERLLHGAPCAIAVAPRGFAERADGLLPVAAAFETLEASGSALASAAGIAAALGSHARAIAVFERPSPADPYFALVRYREFVETLRSEREQRTREACERFGAEFALLDGAPAETLIEASEQLGLIVCGSRGYGPLRRVILGAVSGELIERAACPVVVVPRGVERPFGAVTADD